MKITEEQIRTLRPCADGFNWYLKNKEEDLERLLLSVNKERPDWARWLFTRIMSKKQRIEIAVFSAELVIDIFEKKHPEDKRPRDAIEAAKKVISANTLENRKLAAYAAYAADAADAAYAAYAADAAYAANAANAANAAASAADAAAYAADAADAAYAAASAADAAADAADAADAAYAAYAAASAADAAYAAYAAADKITETQEKIIMEAVRILERDENEK